MTREQIRALLSERPALVCTLFGEAAGEPIQSQIAVGCVIRNRVHADLSRDRKPDWWGEGYAEVCLKRSQFSCWWEHNQNSQRVYDLAEALIARQPQRGLIAELEWIAEGIIGDVLRDVTRGADHYCTVALYQSPARPTWAKTIHATVGAHVFFRLAV